MVYYIEIGSVWGASIRVLCICVCIELVFNDVTTEGATVLVL